MKALSYFQDTVKLRKYLRRARAIGVGRGRLLLYVSKVTNHLALEVIYGYPFI